MIKECRQYNIYKWYLLNFKEKNNIKKSIEASMFVRTTKYFLTGFLHGFSLFLWNPRKKHFCPHCTTPVDDITFYESPLYMYGCDKCRTKIKEN